MENLSNIFCWCQKKLQGFITCSTLFGFVVSYMGKREGAKCDYLQLLLETIKYAQLQDHPIICEGKRKAGGGVTQQRRVEAWRVIESLCRIWGQGSRLYRTMRSSMRQGPLARALPPLEPTLHVRTHLTNIVIFINSSSGASGSTKLRRMY